MPQVQFSVQNMPRALKVDLDEEFPHLSRAPVVEAVLDLKTVPTAPWEETFVTKQLSELLVDYPHIAPHREIAQQIMFGKAEAPIEDRGWVGVRFASQDRRNVADFGRS